MSKLFLCKLNLLSGLSLAILAGLLLGACQPQALPASASPAETVAAPENAETQPAAMPGEPVTPVTKKLQVIQATPTTQDVPASLETFAPAQPALTEFTATPVPSALLESVTRLLPDSEVVYGPSAVEFDLPAYLKIAGGTLAGHREYLASTGWTSAADILERVALENSVNPRLLLALLEYQCHCVLENNTGELDSEYALGVNDYHWKGLYGQMWWAANQLSSGYYGWKEGWLGEDLLPDGSKLQINPQTNPGSAALVVYFSRLWAVQDQSAKMGAQAWKLQHPLSFDEKDWRQALDPQTGFLALYQQMFGSAWDRARQVEPLTPPGLQQPTLILPFEPGWLWSFTSGPHRVWEKEGSWAALDFAPASDRTGCLDSKAWVVAVGSGPVVRVGNGIVVQDLDDVSSGSDGVLSKSDNKEQTGWAIFYMHISSRERVEQGTYLQAGQRIGHPSCEGGPATGTHLHIARKYNGEWIAAAGSLPFVMDGWVLQGEQNPYEGKLVKGDQIVIANPYASFITHITRPQADSTAIPTAPADVK